MNVLYLIHYAGQGGTERYLQTLAQRLRDDGRVTPFFAYTEDGLLASRMKELGIPSVRIPLKNRYSLSAARQVAKYCRENHIEVIHTHFLRENYIALLSRLFYKKPRVIYTNHLILTNDMVTRLSNRILSRLQHAVIAVCNPGKDQMVKNGIPKRLIRVIHNGVDPDEWCVERRTEENKVPALLYAARLVEGKGHLALIEALSKIHDVPYRFVLAGDGPLREETLSAAEQKGVPVTYLGFREDMPAVLASVDININAAGTEACSFNILEAMASGLPQAVADAGGNADLIDGQNGLLFPYGDSEAMAEAIRRLLTDRMLRESCSRRALEAARSRFHIRHMLDDTFALYKG